MKDLSKLNKEIDEYKILSTHPNYLQEPKEKRLCEKKKYWENIHKKQDLEKQLRVLLG